jgi:hypothetical protein
MKYYIRRKEGPPILGPFSIEELNAKLTAGEIGKEWVATSDLGESQEKLLRVPARDWSDITRLQGITYIPQPDSLGGEAGGAMTASVHAYTGNQSTASSGFFGALFDFSFSEFITTKLLKVIYGLAIVAGALPALGAIVLAFRQSFFQGIGMSVAAAILYVIFVSVIRLWLEMTIVIFRIAEHVRSIDNKKSK